jgi:hypothetical protein
MQLALFDADLPQSPYCNVRAVQPELAKLVVGFDWEVREPTEREQYRLARQIEVAGEMVRGVTFKEYGALEDEAIDFGTPPKEQEAPMSSIKSDYDHGRYAGYHNLVAQLLDNRKNEAFRLGFAVGRDQAASEHRDNESIIFESAGMSAYARRGRVGG